MYVMNMPKKPEDYLHLVEFSYNNNYQASLKMSPFEVLYGRRHKVPLSWGYMEDRMALGPDMLAQMEEMVRQINQNLKAAQDRQKSYADRKQTSKEYRVGEHVFLRVKPKKSKLRIGLYAKLAPRYVGPFENFARIGPVAYQLALPPYIRIHDVFHIYLLKKYVVDQSHIINRDSV